ncbi:FAD-dependent oxidoreductase, partial [Pseudonocardia sp. K10HN5]|nr:FAD-dependent oxidoreductase [Pseudonocardia acidicola]
MSGGVDRLRAAMAGPVLVCGDAGYEDARAIWNGDIDRCPAVVAQCASAADVVAALGHGQEEGLEITVRGGGHSYAGACLTDDGLMIDLSRMRGVHVDPDARIAR